MDLHYVLIILINQWFLFAFLQNFAAQYEGAKGPDPGPGPMVRTPSSHKHKHTASWPTYITTVPSVYINSNLT